ncbi:MAG: hypothetical protein ACD_62C00089G0002 [uncultured bacterium]|nr:MAG: hypothetical protein ACD_62C00089G0002 [uncultured bacterium]
MDQTATIITAVSTPEYKKIVIETLQGLRYTADLACFESVYCFPKNFAEWQKVSIDSDSLALIWSSRFEVHGDQVIALSMKKEALSFQNQSASCS